MVGQSRRWSDDSRGRCKNSWLPATNNLHQRPLQPSIRYTTIIVSLNNSHSHGYLTIATKHIYGKSISKYLFSTICTGNGCRYNGPVRSLRYPYGVQRNRVYSRWVIPAAIIYQLGYIYKGNQIINSHLFLNNLNSHKMIKSVNKVVSLLL